MSFDADTLFGEIKKLQKQFDILRSQSRTDFSSGGGGSNGGYGVGGSTVTTPSVHATFALNPIIHRLDEASASPFALTGSITLRGASVIVEEGTNNASSTLEFHTINGTLNDGQILTMKPKEGKTLTLKTGGNIDITSDQTVTDKEFVILQFFVDNNTTPNTSGTYSLLSGGGGGSSGFVNPSTTSLDMGSWNINNVSELRFINNATNTGTQLRIIARDTITADGTFDRLEYEVDNLGGHDFYVDKVNTTYPRLGITETSIQSNVPLDMNLNHIIFQAITGVSAPTGLEKRFLFSNSANSDHLSVRTSTGIVDLESSGDLDNLSDVTITLPIGYGALVYDTGTSQWVNTQIRNNEVSASANIDWTKINKTGSALNDFDDTSIVNSTNTVIKFDGGLSKWVAGSVQNDQVASNANIDWTKINKTGSSLSDLDDTVIGTPNSRDIIQWSGMNWTTSKVYDDNVASSANISLSKINISTFGLDTLSDVTITGPVGNGAIIYDTGTSTWINSQVRNDQVSVSANIDQSKINLSITNSELAGGDYNAITGIGSQVQTLDMNDNMITNVEMIGIVDTGGTARGSISGDSTQGLVFAQPLITMKDVTTNIATFSKATNNGIDFHANVSMNTNYRITDVEDPVNNQDVVTKAWHNANASAVAKLNDIGDCTIGTTPTSNTVLKESGGGWVDGNVTYANIDSSTWADFDTHIIPISDDDYDLGSSTNQWRNLYVNDTAYLDKIGFGNDVCTLPTNNGNNGQVLTTNGSGTLTWSTPSSSGANQQLNNLSGTIAINQTLIPQSDDVYSLGTSSKQWRNLFVTGTAYLDSIAFGTDSMTLPTNDGSNGQVLTTNGSSALSWTTPSSGGGWTGTAGSQLNMGAYSIKGAWDGNSSTLGIQSDLDMNTYDILDACRIELSTSGSDVLSDSTMGINGTGYNMHLNVPSGDDFRFSIDGDTVLEIQTGSYDHGLELTSTSSSTGKSSIRSSSSSYYIGHHVSDSNSVGSKGSMGIPYYHGYYSVNLDGVFGNKDGCIGILKSSTSGSTYFFARSGGVWKNELLS
mgnify:FL=1